LPVCVPALAKGAARTFYEGGHPENSLTNLTVKPLEHIFMNYPSYGSVYFNVNVIRLYAMVLIFRILSSFISSFKLFLSQNIMGRCLKQKT
jgi:hypothetical protein